MGNVNMHQQELRLRTKQYAIRIVKLCGAMPKSYDARILGAQLLRSGTSVGANYRAVCRARTKKEFIAKLRIVLEEADESQFWLEILAETELLKPVKLSALLQESSELVAIFTASLNTARSRPE